MESINLSVSVSSSLSGKDLWLLKTFINNKFTTKNLDITYTEDEKKCNIYIIKKFEGGKDRHFAIIKNTNTKLPILPYLNPVTLKRLFLFLGKEDSIKRYQLNINKTNISDYQIYKFINFSSKKIMEIIHPSFHLILDNINNHVFCSEKLNESFFWMLKNTPIQDMKIKDRSEELNINSDYDQMEFELFKWEMGVLLYERFFEKSQINNWLFKQSDWPDYGSLSFEKEFIQLSSLLSHQTMTYKELTEKFKNEVVNSFLNALYLTQSLELQEIDHNYKQTTKTVKHSKFLTSFKMFLNKIHF